MFINTYLDNPTDIWDVDIKACFFVEIMENMDKYTVPKLVLIVWLKIPQMPQKISARKFFKLAQISKDRYQITILSTIHRRKRYFDKLCTFRK